MEFVIRKGSEIYLKTLESSVKNKFKWIWLEGKDKNGQFYSEYLRKIKEPGLAWCVACKDKINYGSSGKNAFAKHADRIQYTCIDIDKIKYEPKIRVRA